MQEITPIFGILNGTLRPPGSKSITNRALLMAALADGQSELIGVLESDDTRVMIEGLRKLGVSIETNLQQQTAIIEGCGGQFPQPQADIDVENSGTTIRFLTAALAMAGGHYRLDGIPRMRQRPIGPLVDALQMLGADVKTESPDQCPPVVIDSPRVAGGETRVRGDLSSQYLSGLLMAAPLAQSEVRLAVEGALVSRPYIEMTLKMQHDFGVQPVVSSNADQFIFDSPTAYRSTRYTIEPDASAASYFFAAAAICGGRATVLGLDRSSLQGDIRFVECLAKMGCTVEYADDSTTVIGPAQRGIDIDMSEISDTVQTLTAVALFVDGPTRIRNVAHNRIKETDRIGNLAIELRKFGATVTEFDDGLSIQPVPTMTGATIETYNDHRMAMSLALVGLKVPGVKILNPDCVAKTYPQFFADLKRFCR